MIHAKAINHIGIAVRSIDAQREFYEQILEAHYEHVEEVPDQQVRVAFFLVGPPGCEVRIELLEPTSDDSPIARHIDKRGEGLHHIAYTVTDIDKRLEQLRERGVRLIDDTPRLGAHQQMIAFLHPKSTGGTLTEICEPASHEGEAEDAAGP
jgi:methylmalonyl-CoA/ethylmalonyl-CoA epimerase